MWRRKRREQQAKDEADAEQRERDEQAAARQRIIDEARK